MHFALCDRSSGPQGQAASSTKLTKKLSFGIDTTGGIGMVNRR
jgi:hypothetical protein